MICKYPVASMSCADATTLVLSFELAGNSSSSPHNMARLTATLLFAVVASAQTANYTTTAWLTDFAGSDKYGYVASVIDADDQHMTLSLDYDSNTDRDALHVGGPAGNFTLGREASSFTVRDSLRAALPTPTSDAYFQIACTRPAQQGGEVICNSTFGEGYARYLSCREQLTQTDRRVPPNSTTTYPHTYGSGIWGEPGSEVVTQTFNYHPGTATTTPAWCTSDTVPESELSGSYTTSAAEFAVYQVVIYAGQEKLSALTADSTASPTASVGGSASAAAPESTGAAGKNNVLLPAIVGVGITVMIFTL